MTKLFERFGDQLEQSKSLAPYTTFKIGGPAQYFLVVRTQEDFIDAMRIAKQEGIKVFVLGGGSNVLISSDGFEGLVLKNEMRHLEVSEHMITAESGVILATILSVAKKHGLQGIAKLQGVPGTFGAGVRGNVGVPNCELGDFVVSAVILDEDLQIKRVDRDYFEYAYRYSKLKENKEIILEATIELTPGGDPDAIHQEMMETLKMRKAKQPWGKSGGSYFKNPSKEFAAGYLIDQVGGKGSAVGDAAISDKHGNFFLNAGEATSHDVQALANSLKDKVKQQFDIDMHEEVEFIE